MVVASSIRPYEYVGPFPFSGSGILPIGFSGILFEQAMFTILAESELYTYQTIPSRLFTKYINKDASISFKIEPHAQGLNLAGNNPDVTGASGLPGCINFKNYITDMRLRFSGIFDLMVQDSPYSADIIRLEYFQKHTGDNASGSLGNWLHSNNELGTSGSIFDIDLREVTYQPYTRIGKFKNDNFSGIEIPYSPITPTFCGKNGEIITVSTRDMGHATQIGGNAAIGYFAAFGDTISIEGDVLVPNVTKFYLWESGNLLTSNTGNCNSAVARYLDNGADLMPLNSGYGLFSVPSNNQKSGIYSVQLFNNSAVINNYYTPTSGRIGFWPPLSDLVGSGYIRATVSDGSNEVFTSGFHVFKTALWQIIPSGAYIQSPINGLKLWIKFSDNTSWSTTNFGPKRWTDISSPPAMPIIGANSSLLFYAGTTADLDPNPVIDDRRFVFVKYDADDFDLLGGIEEQHVIPSPNSPPSVDRFLFIYDHSPPSGVNFSNYYCISEVATLSSGPEVYILNSDLENIGAWDNNTNPASAVVGMINQHLYGYDPNQAVGSGATFFWQHNVFDDPSNVFPMNPATVGVVDTAVHIYETRDTVFDDTTNIGQLFEPINPNNFSFGGLPRLIDPRGTDLDWGDGSTLVIFNAKMKGETVLKTFLGRIKEGTISGTGVLKIVDFTVLADGTPSWVYGI